MLFPSNTPNGRRLKVAKTELIRHINPKISFNNNDSKNTNKYKKNVMLAINKFANGPANAIFPISKILTFPLNITAPGAAKTIGVKNPRIKANIRPLVYILYSDHR